MNTWNARVICLFGRSLRIRRDIFRFIKQYGQKKGAYLAGTFGQMSIACIMVFLLRSNGITADHTTALGMAAVGIGGTFSAVWGVRLFGK